MALHRRRESEPDWRLLRAKEYIEENYTDKLPLEELAAEAYISVYHFQRLFIAAFGFSPLEYTEKLRVDDALRRLSAGESMSSIALAVGFYDQSHFCRTFRKLSGVTPQQYRKTLPES